MRRDSRGRVRFGWNGYRFELTRTGLNIYRREVFRRGPEWLTPRLSESEWTLTDYAYYAALRELLSTEEGRAKFADALTAVDQTLFTTAVHIPPHMKAVP